MAIDRGIRLCEKRSLPYVSSNCLGTPTSFNCILPSSPNRDVWYKARDSLYEEIMQKAWNPKKEFFSQSYEDKVEGVNYVLLDFSDDAAVRTYLTVLCS